MPYALKQKLKEVPYLSFIKITIKGIAEASGFADVLSCKKSSIRLRSLERPPAIVLIETIRAVLNSRMRAKFANSHLPKHSQTFVIVLMQQQTVLTHNSSTVY
jgi:hypothetical protein